MKYVIAFIVLSLLSVVAFAAPQTWTWNGTITGIDPDTSTQSLKVGDTVAYTSVFDPQVPSFPIDDRIALYNGGIDFCRPTPFNLGTLNLAASDAAIWWMVSGTGINWPPGIRYTEGTHVFGSNGEFWAPVADQPNTFTYVGKFLITCVDTSQPYAFSLPASYDQFDIWRNGIVNSPNVGGFDSATFTLTMADGGKVYGTMTGITPEPASCLLIGMLGIGLMLRRIRTR